MHLRNDRRRNARGSPGRRVEAGERHLRPNQLHFAAIPAVVAYNRYTHDVDRLATRFETFIEEFSNILQRQG